MTILFFIAILVVLIWVHELGHFSVAKLFRVRVDEFAIGFPPRLLTVQWGETRYSFNLLLVGGYVNIYGEQGEGQSDPRSLVHKSRPVQAAVILAGVVFNVLFAWLILTAGYVVGMPSAVEHQGYGVVTNARPTIVSVLPDSPADKAGIEANDIVVALETARESLDLRTVSQDRQAQMVHGFLTSHPNESVVIHVERGGAEQNFVVRAEEGLVEGRKAVGVQLGDVGVLRLPPHTAALQGAYMGWYLLSSQAQALAGFVGQAVRGVANIGELSGPIGIVAAGSEFVAQGWAGVVFITAVISLNLALVNLLPIPGLDGGRLLFIIVESIIRRPISQRLATSLTIAGFALLIGLMIFVSVSDISKLVG